MINIYGYIYLIKNNMNGKVYIGQTTTGFDKRYKYNVAKNTHNKHLKASFEKYGLQNFTIMKEFDSADTLEELNRKEEFYIQLFRATDKDHGYNITYGGDNFKMSEEHKKKLRENSYWKGKHIPEEIKQKLSEGMKGRFVGELNPNYGNHALAGENHPNYGKHLSEDTRNKISEKHKGLKCPEHCKKLFSERYKGEGNPNYGKTHSEEKRKEISEKVKLAYAEGRLVCTNKTKVVNMDTMEVFNTITDAKKKYGGDISKCVRKITKKAGGYRWMYYSEYTQLEDDDTQRLIFM